MANPGDSTPGDPTQAQTQVSVDPPLPPNPADPKQLEAWAQQVREKALRDRTMPAIWSWPMDPATGQPMAIVVGMGSDLTPTVPFGNVTIQSTVMRPVSNESLSKVIEEGDAVQKAAEYLVGTNRRLIQYAVDPQSIVTHPVTGEPFDVQAAAQASPPGTNPGNLGGQPPAGTTPSPSSPPPAPAPAAQPAAPASPPPAQTGGGDSGVSAG